jgi:hypothetical protein
LYIKNRTTIELITTSEVLDWQKIIVLHAAKGDFKGKEKKRVYILEIYSLTSPRMILLEGRQLKQQKNEQCFKAAASGWFYETKSKKGIIHIKTPILSTYMTTTLREE